MLIVSLPFISVLNVMANCAMTSSLLSANDTVVDYLFHDAGQSIQADRICVMAAVQKFRSMAPRFIVL